MSGNNIAERLYQLIADYEPAKNRVKKMIDSIEEIYKDSAELISTSLI